MISDLFSSGEAGAFFSAAATETMFTDAAKTTNVANDGDLIYVQESVDYGQSVIHERVQATEGSRPVYRIREDGVAYIDYAGAKTWSITGSSSSMKYMHDGTGSSLISLIEKKAQPGVTSSILRSASSSSQTGFLFMHQGSTGRIYNLVYKGSAPPAASGYIENAMISVPIKMYAATYKTGSDPVMKQYTDLAVDTVETDSGATPSSGNSTSDITWVSGSNHKEYHTLFLNRVMTQTEIQEAYAELKLTSHYAIPAMFDYCFILLNQSNQSGKGDMITTLSEEKQVGVYSYSKAQEFNIATIPEHSGINVTIETSPKEADDRARHGVSLRLAKAINTLTGKTVLLLPLAVGGTSIDQWDEPENQDLRYTLYGFFKMQWLAVRDRVRTPIMIMIGSEETASEVGPAVDLVNGGVGQEYQNQMVTWMDHFKRDMGIPDDLPVLQAQLAIRTNKTFNDKAVKGAEAQRQLENIIPRCFVVPTFDQPKIDDVHMNRQGVTVAADRMILAFRQHLLGEEVNGTGPRLLTGSLTSTTTITLVYDKALKTITSDAYDFFHAYEEGVEQTISSVVRGTPTTNVVITLSAPVSGNVTVTYGYTHKTDYTVTYTDIVRDDDDFPALLFGPMSVNRAATTAGVSRPLLTGAG